jgi:hydrogenase expression/formation protein HypE
MPLSSLPIGKLPADHLGRLLDIYRKPDPRLIIGPKVGEDVAVIDMGDRYLVAKSDPITFATDEIGWYVVNINANDVACSGATPRWFLSTLLLPEHGTSIDMVDTIFRQIGEACEQLNVTLAGGHTEVTHGLDRPIVVGHIIGEVPRDRFVATSGVKVGDDIVLTKGLAVEATALIAREKEDELTSIFSAEYLHRCQEFLHQPGISVVRDAQIATSAGRVHAMHDPTEGGLSTGLWEMAEAAGVGMAIERESIPVLPETVTLCEHFDLDVLGVIASGSLLIACPPSDTNNILSGLYAAGISAARIGQAVDQERGLRIDGKPLPAFARDEIAKIFEQK